LAPSSGMTGIMLKPARKAFTDAAWMRYRTTKAPPKLEALGIMARNPAKSTLAMTRFDTGPAALIRPFCSFVTAPEIQVAPGAPWRNRMGAGRWNANPSRRGWYGNPAKGPNGEPPPLPR